MHYVSPQEAITLINSSPEKDNPFLQEQLARIQRGLKYLDETYVSRRFDLWGDAPLIEKRDFISKETLIQISTGQLRRILSLFPIEASVRGKKELLDIIAHFYLNSWWPTESDKVNHEEWLDVLEIAAAYLHRFR